MHQAKGVGFLHRYRGGAGLKCQGRIGRPLILPWSRTLEVQHLLGCGMGETQASGVKKKPRGWTSAIENIPKNWEAQGRGMHPGVTQAVAEAFGRVADYSGFWIVRREGAAFREVGLHQAQVFIPSHLRDSDKHAVYAWMKQSGLFG